MSKNAIFNKKAEETAKLLESLHGTTLDDKPKAKIKASAEFAQPAAKKKTYTLRIYEDVSDQADEIREQLFKQTENPVLKNRSELVEYLLKKFIQENS